MLTQDDKYANLQPRCTPFFCSHQVLNAGTDQVYCFLKQKKKLKRKADLFLENDGDGKALLNTD